jgi:methyl-accepting chemotaxis protein
MAPPSAGREINMSQNHIPADLQEIDKNLTEILEEIKQLRADMQSASADKIQQIKNDPLVTQARKELAEAAQAVQDSLKRLNSDT